MSRLRSIPPINGIALVLFLVLLGLMLLNPQHVTDYVPPLLVTMLVAYLAPAPTT